jgi:hypothetical protein
MSSTPSRSSTPPSDISDIVNSFSRVKSKIKQLQILEEEYKLRIHEYMDINKQDFIQTKGSIDTDITLSGSPDFKILIVRNKTKRETVTKKDVPVDIWKQYVKKTEYTTLTIKILENEQLPDF